MSDDRFPVVLVFSPAQREVIEEVWHVQPGTTLAGVLTLSGWRERFALDRSDALTFGIWGRVASLQTELRPCDRIELYRPLKADPKVARRERFRKQGSKAAGLFAQRRPGAKSGY